jgi:hypothetical protein
MTNRLRIIILILISVPTLALAIHHDAGATDTLPFCYDIDPALLDAWVPADGPICIAEDDEGWVDPDTAPITATPVVTG